MDEKKNALSTADKVEPMTPVEQHESEKSSQTQDVLHTSHQDKTTQENIQTKAETVVGNTVAAEAPGMKPSVPTDPKVAAQSVLKPRSVKVYQWIMIALAFLNLFVIVAFLTIPSFDLALTAAINEATYLVVFYCFFHYQYILLRFAKIFSLVALVVSVLVGMGHVVIFLLEITAGTSGNFVQRVTNGVPLAELDQQAQAEVIPFVTTVFLIAVGLYVVVFLIPLITTFFLARREAKSLLEIGR